MNIRKAILKVFSANFIQLISGIIVGFVVPAILSLEEYANLKTYTLYMSYVGILHLGFLDGMYLKYGGKKINEIDESILKAEHNSIVFVEAVITCILLVISLVCKNLLIFMIGISIIPAIISTFYKAIYQATGEFGKYSNIIYIYTITYTIINIVLAFVVKSENYIMYGFATFISTVFSIAFYEYKFIKKHRTIKAIYSSELVNNIKTGFFILLGNLSFVLFAGADKWFVKIFLTSKDFAYYSFAISMLNIVNTLLSAISVTFYNYLFKTNSKEKINKLKQYLIILGAFSSFAYFVLSVIVKTCIQKYIPSLSIIAITFATLPYMILINALFVNLYKMKKQEKSYFKTVVAMLVVSIGYNLLAIIIKPNIETIAMATLFAYITWTIYSTIKLDEIYVKAKEIIYLVVTTMTFLILSHVENIYIGGASYLIILIVLTLVLYRDIVKEIIKKEKEK